ncbi:MAG: Tat pathway signal sequence domain protein [Caulobacteraceae bacterium]|nr:Tat pathway signal sequence domain protein [Caulobacteraceae bacterium]
MRRLRLYLFAATASLSLWSAAPSFAQYSGGASRGASDQQAQEDAKKKKRDEEFGAGKAALPALRNAGPCPFAKVLYDAARYVEFKDNVEASAAVQYTGEIQKVASACAYRGAEPIRVQMQVLFEFGRGPRAEGGRKTYRYWVAVTDRNRAVLGKEFFDLPVTFPAGSDRVTLTETLGSVTIPRVAATVSGANFEILIGFEVTPQMAAFNHDGKRFRPNAGQITAQAAAAKP